MRPYGGRFLFTEVKNMLDKRYNPKLVEEGKYDTWKKKGYFEAGDISKKPFSMVIPPPNVTGKLHIGHAWNTTIQDIIARYKKMKGYDVLWLPGMDHAGIATQAKVMEKLRNNGFDVTKITREEFLTKAWEWKKDYAESIHSQWAKLGLALDYSKERFTLDEGLNYAVRKVFVDLYNKGLIYQGERIINWDPVQKTALSNIEVIHENDKGYMYYFKYPIVDSKDYLIVATTRPETMFGDVCVVVNPNDERYKKYVGKKVINPANGDELPIIADEYVTLDFGTGAMKCTPAHDPNDFILGEKYHFPKPIIMNKDATMNEKCGKYAGLDRFVCREQLIKDINDKGYFVKKEEIIHAVGHSERSKAIVEPTLSKQWFVKMKRLAEDAIKNQKGKDKVSFVPKRFEKVFLQWMNNIEDWCVSRQLWWGHRIPAYYNKKTGDVIVSVEPPKDIENYEQDSDVLDTWFSSGLWPFSTLGWPHKTKELERYFPTSILVTAYDIIFFWVSRMIFQSLNATKSRPFDKVLIHGLVRDELGRKMSKSLGNGVDPLVVIDKYGADALRYFLTTNSTPGQDMRYIEEKVQSSMNYLNKIWNSARYVLNVLGEDFKPMKLSGLKLNAVDSWIINKLQYAIKHIGNHMEKYNFNAASQYLYNFVYDDFCSSYLEISKVSLLNEDKEKVNITKQVLYYCLKNIILLIYPYTPFIGEELYQNLPEHLESIMLESYPKCHKALSNSLHDEDVNLLFKVIKDIRNYKIKNKLTPNAEINIQINYKKELFPEFISYLKRFVFIKDVEETKQFIGLGELLVYPTLEILILSNNSKEELKEKLEKEIKFEQEEIARGEKLLSNPGFVNKAPEEKVLLEKRKLETHKINLSNLLEKIKNL